MSTSASNSLPCPRVVFAADFVARLEKFSARISANRVRREELGTFAGAHGGSEFVGYRAYHPGDDPRRIDWSAFARLDRALVRVTRREVGARVAIFVDASASMGVGPPGKLQRAAETALAIAAACLRTSSRARIAFVSDADARNPSIVIDRPAHLRSALAVFSAVEARGVATGAHFARALANDRTSARVVVISDFMSCLPADLVAHATQRRTLDLVRILAPHELGAARTGRTEWFDPEDGARLDVHVDEGTRARYELELGRELERWRSACAAARVAHTLHASSDAFEDIAQECLEQRVMER